MLIFNENPSILGHSFSFLFKNATTNYAVACDTETKKLDVNISIICKPDSISFEIIDACLKSKLITGDDFTKISFILNDGKNSKLKQIFETAQDATAEHNPGFIATNGLEFGAVLTIEYPPF